MMKPHIKGLFLLTLLYTQINYADNILTDILSRAPIEVTPGLQTLRFDGLEASTYDCRMETVPSTLEVKALGKSLKPGKTQFVVDVDRIESSQLTLLNEGTEKAYVRFICDARQKETDNPSVISHPKASSELLFVPDSWIHIRQFSVLGFDDTALPRPVELAISPDWVLYYKYQGIYKAYPSTYFQGIFKDKNHFKRYKDAHEQAFFYYLLKPSSNSGVVLEAKGRILGGGFGLVPSTLETYKIPNSDACDKVSGGLKAIYCKWTPSAQNSPFKPSSAFTNAQKIRDKTDVLLSGELDAQHFNMRKFLQDFERNMRRRWWTGYKSEAERDLLIHADHIVYQVRKHLEKLIEIHKVLEEISLNKAELSFDARMSERRKLIHTLTRNAHILEKEIAKIRDEMHQWVIASADERVSHASDLLQKVSTDTIADTQKIQQASLELARDIKSQLLIRLKTPSLGPIIGEATPNALRILVGHPALLEEDHACAVVQISTNETFTENVQTRIVPLNMKYYGTGVAIFTGLTADTTYFYRVGTHEGEFHDFFGPNVQWQHKSKKTTAHCSRTKKSKVHRIHIQPDGDAPVCLLSGSCRYVMETFLFGKSFFMFDDSSDKTYGTMWERHIKPGADEPVQLILMTGDQIYGDDTNAIAPDNSPEEFGRKYQHVFTTKQFRRVARSTSLLMTGDDHDGGKDNFEGSAQAMDGSTLSYQTFQYSHSPGIPISTKPIDSELDVSRLGEVKKEKLADFPPHFYYTTQSGMVDIFVMDCRRERDRKNKKMISDKQMGDLKAWLTEQKERVKLIVTSVPISPTSSSGGGDKWGDEDYREQRNEIIDFINAEQIPRVIFNTGDVHNSWVSQIKLPAGGNIISTVSSPLFWPWPFAKGKPRDYNLNGPMLGRDDVQITTDVSTFTAENAYMYMAINGDGVQTKIISRKGAVLSEKAYNFSH